MHDFHINIIKCPKKKKRKQGDRTISMLYTSMLSLMSLSGMTVKTKALMSSKTIAIKRTHTHPSTQMGRSSVSLYGFKNKRHSKV